MTRERRLRILRAVATAGLAIAWVGLLCRGKDGTAVTATLFYATPWLLRLMAGVLAASVLKHWGFRLMAVTCVVVSLFEGWQSWGRDNMAIWEDAITASVWNAGRDLDGNPSAWSAVGDADISAVIECGNFSEDEWKRFTEANPGHDWQRFDTSTMLGVRGKILSHESLGVHDLFRCNRVKVMLPHRGEMTVIVVDVRSQPWISREPSLTGILKVAAGDPNTIILGDFNTPPESKWFRAWRERGLVLADDAPRRGFRETWAYGVPLLTLDHVWIGPRWKALWTDRSRHGSDHAMVTCWLEAK